MPIQTQSADGILHEFPDGTAPEIVDKAMKDYVAQNTPKPSSMAERFGTGLSDVMEEGAKLSIATTPKFLQPPGAEENNQRFLAADKERTKQIEGGERAAGVQGFDLPRVAGQATAGLLMAPETGAGFLADAALAGGIQGAISPSKSAPGTSNYWVEKGFQTTEGVASSALFSLGAKAVEKVVSPVLPAAQKLLSDKGVKLTWGQILGEGPKAVEEFTARFPIIGSFIRSGEAKTNESFNIATVNQALEPIGIKVPKGTNAGHDLVSFMKDTLSKAYNDTYSKSSLAITPQLNTDLIPVIQKAASLPDAQLQQFNKILTDEFLKPLTKQGGITGTAVKDVDSNINFLAQSYITSSVAGERNLGVALKELRELVKSSIKNQNANIASKIDDLDASYAMATRIENAASRRSDAKGIFNPKDLLVAVKKGDTSIRDRNFAAGDALFQTWAEAADEVIPSNLKKSYLIGAEEIGAVGGAIATGTTMKVLPLFAAGAAGAKAAYSDLGLDLANYLAATPPGLARQTFTNILNRAAKAPAAAATEEVLPQ